jgi:hypothetical protein
MLPVSTLPGSLLAVAGIVRSCFTAASFEVFCQLLAGMVAATGRRTVCGMLSGAGLAAVWPHDRAHQFFSRAAWDPDRLAGVLATAVVALLVPDGAPVTVAVDDTLFRRSGKKVWAAAWAHDGSAKNQTKIGYGNTWVVLAVLVDLPFACRPVALPVAARLWRGKATASRAEIALAMVATLARVLDRPLHVVADAAYHHPGVADLPGAVSWTTRLPTNAALTGPPPPRTGGPGRPRKKGERLGSLTQIGAGARWRTVTVSRYGRHDTAQVAETRCQWHGLWKDLPVRAILLREGSRYYDLALITTDLTTPAAQVIARYAARWGIEMVFQQCREHLGVGQARNRTPRAVARTVPFGLTAYTLTIVWYARHGHHRSDAADRRAAAPW